MCTKDLSPSLQVVSGSGNTVTIPAASVQRWCAVHCHSSRNLKRTRPLKLKRPACVGIGSTSRGDVGESSCSGGGGESSCSGDGGEKDGSGVGKPATKIPRVIHTSILWYSGRPTFLPIYVCVCVCVISYIPKTTILFLSYCLCSWQRR